MKPVTYSFPLVALLCAATLVAQGTSKDYERAASLGARYGNKLVRFQPSVSWLDDGAGVTFTERIDGGPPRTIQIDARTGARTVSTSDGPPSRAGRPVPLKPKSTIEPSKRSGAETTIVFENRLRRPVRLFWSDETGALRSYGEIAPGQKRGQHTFAGHVWVTDFAANDLTGIFVANENRGLAIIDAASRRASATRRAPRARFTAFVRDHDVYATNAAGEEVRLTNDGTPERPYRRPTAWSPSGTRALGFRVTNVERRRIPLVASSPKSQVQPTLEWIDYVKPGDALERPVPVLYDFAKGVAIPVDEAPFDDAYDVSKVRWCKDSQRVFCLYNQRGHQRLSLLAINATTGAVTTIVEEVSKTFVDYSQKTFIHWEDNDELLWMSERDGWNHLYRFDATTGRLLNQVTKGKWVVRRVERVDSAARQIWFTALGIHEDQDPYHEHLARVDFDGKNLTVITQSDGTHTWTISPDQSLVLAKWSRVDQPTVTELRRTSDGTLVAELGRDDAKPLMTCGFLPPERFVAKGRDGKTDIYGIIIRPSNFDKSRRYPVIESIYAGPHSFHVPKSFGLGLRERRIAELGFIIVQIDGMGTNWRSKSFHDVCWRNLKDAGLPDRIAWMRAAAAQHREMDIERVGIFGGSAGGQNALAALLHHGDFYDVAVADCGCHDNRMDKIWWNEAWMGLMGPHYAENSNVTHAGRLSGKLLLTVGELDKNVDPASTMQVVNALIQANKDFDLLVVPGAGHGVGETPYAARRRQDFFVRHLLRVEPRR